MLLGFSWQLGIASAGVFATSSTAVITKLLTERMQLDSAHGREIMGVLLFQDLAVVPLLATTPARRISHRKSWPVLLGVAMIKAAPTPGADPRLRPAP